MGTHCLLAGAADLRFLLPLPPCFAAAFSFCCSIFCLCKLLTRGLVRSVSMICAGAVLCAAMYAGSLLQMPTIPSAGRKPLQGCETHVRYYAGESMIGTSQS